VFFFSFFFGNTCLLIGENYNTDFILSPY